MGAGTTSTIQSASPVLQIAVPAILQAVQSAAAQPLSSITVYATALVHLDPPAIQTPASLAHPDAPPAAIPPSAHLAKVSTISLSMLISARIALAAVQIPSHMFNLANV